MALGLKLNCKTLCLYMLAILFTGSLHAQDITGTWQGTLSIPQGRPPRIVLHVTRDDSGALKASIRSLGVQINRPRHAEHDRSFGDISATDIGAVSVL